MKMKFILVFAMLCLPVLGQAIEMNQSLQLHAYLVYVYGTNYEPSEDIIAQDAVYLASMDPDSRELEYIRDQRSSLYDDIISASRNITNYYANCSFSIIKDQSGHPTGRIPVCFTHSVANLIEVNHVNDLKNKLNELIAEYNNLTVQYNTKMAGLNSSRSWINRFGLPDRLDPFFPPSDWYQGGEINWMNPSLRPFYPR